MTSPSEKACTLCRFVQPITEYYISRGRRNARCKYCQKWLAYQNEMRKKTGELPTCWDYLEGLARTAERKALLGRGEKRCCKCKQVKPMCMFPKRGTKLANGDPKRDSYCKMCKNEMNRGYVAPSRGAVAPEKPEPLRKPERHNDTLHKLLHSKW